MNQATTVTPAWVPGAPDLDQSTSLATAFDWLEGAERATGQSGVIVMTAKSMIRNDRLLAREGESRMVISPQSSDRANSAPTLCVWPGDGEVLELAEEVAARGGALCVVAGRYDIAGWIAKTNAECLIDDPDLAKPVPSIPVAAQEELRYALLEGGHNGFAGAGDKRSMIRALRAISVREKRPAPADLKTYLDATGQTTADGVKQAVKWYREVLDGKRHRDHDGYIDC